MDLQANKELISLFTHPVAVMRPVTHIFLLSHMRAYTSLFGHILGSNPAIEGYYEMHMGYFSWRSLLRQKLLYYREHSPKPKARYIFDKILHNEHHIATSLLSRDDVVPIVSIREPGPTIYSIVKQYERVNPEHNFARVDFATQYYLSRLAVLSRIARNLSGRYVYLDARALTSKADSTLTQLSDLLTLKSPLTPDYQTMRKTGQGNTGDHSPDIKSGHIQQKNVQKYDESDFNISRLAELEDAYAEARSLCIEFSQSSIVLD